MPNLCCDICSKHYLKGHISSEHDINKSYKCPICNVIFVVNNSLKGHVSSEHEKNKS